MFSPRFGIRKLGISRQFHLFKDTLFFYYYRKVPFKNFLSRMIKSG